MSASIVTKSVTIPITLAIIMETSPPTTDDTETSRFELFFVFLLGSMEDMSETVEDMWETVDYPTLTTLSFCVADPTEDDWPPIATEASLSCPVCYEDVPWADTACLAQCHHALCTACLTRLLHTSLPHFRDPTCPLCRAVIQELLFENESTMRSCQTALERGRPTDTNDES